VLIATCSFDLIVILRRGSHNAATQLRVIPLREPSLLEVLLARGVTSWMPTHASQPLVTRLGSVSTFLSYHARGSPLGVAPSWVVSVPRFPSGGVGTSRVRSLPIGTRTYGLEATFFFVTCSELSRREASLRCLSLAMSLSWRRLSPAMPLSSDASIGRRLS